MEFFSKLADKYHKQYKPKQTEDGEVAEKIDWEDYNYPSSWPLFYYDKEKITGKRAIHFMSVRLYLAQTAPDLMILRLHREELTLLAFDLESG